MDDFPEGSYEYVANSHHPKFLLILRESKQQSELPMGELIKASWKISTPGQPAARCENSRSWKIDENNNLQSREH